VDQVGDRVAQPPPLLVAHPPRQRDRLVADPAGDVDVLDGEPQDRHHLVVVDRPGNGRHVDDLHPRPADRLDRLQLRVEERPPAQRRVDPVVEAVELQVDRVEAGLGRPRREIGIRQLDPVRRDLQVREAQFASVAEDVEEVGVDRRLAAGELHHAPLHRLLAAVEAQHLLHLLARRLVHRPGDVRVGETDRAGQVAAVREVDVAEHGVARVPLAEPAVLRALLAVGERVAQAAEIAELPPLGLQVQLDVRPVQVLHVPVGRARLLHPHLAALGEQPPVDHPPAPGLRAERLDRLRQPLGDVVDENPAEGVFSTRIGSCSSQHNSYSPSVTVKLTPRRA